MRWISLAVVLACPSIANAQGLANPTNAVAWGLEVVAGDPDAGDGAGVDVAIQGDYVFVGAARDDGAGSNVGAVYVYLRPTPPSGAWTQVAKIMPPSGSDDENFGRSIAVEGTTLVVGSPMFYQQPPGPGRVYVYEGAGANWTFISELTGPVVTPGAGFAAVEISGDRIVVGAGENANRTGGAWIFSKAGPDWTSYTWQPLIPAAGAWGIVSGDKYGHDVTIDGDIVAISASGNAAFASTNGAVYVWEYDGATSAWTNVDRLAYTTQVLMDGFGYGLDLDDTTIVTGATARDVVVGGMPMVDAGEAYVYVRTGGVMGAGTWALQTVLQRPDSDVQANEAFGFAVDIDGDRAIVTANADVQGAMDFGAAYVFARNSGAWTLQGQKVLSTHATDSDGFGRSVAFDGDRNAFVIGANEHDHSTTQPLSGGAFVFALTAPPETYCTAKLSSQACLPSIGFSGASNASASAAVPFNITCTQVIPNKFGIFFYGVSGPFAAPFQGGHLCVKPPIVRTSPQNSGGSGPCTGSYTFDLNALIQSGTAPELYPGVRVCSQYWYRDPPSSFTVGLSDALDLVIAP